MRGENVSDDVKIDNLIMRVFLETTESIIGPNGLRSILNYGGLQQYINTLPPDNDELEIPVEHLNSLYRSINETFGDNGAYTLKLRVGRENVRRGLEKRPTIAKAMRMASRLLSETRRMRLGLERLMEYMDRGSSADSETPHVEFREEDDYFFIIQRENLESLAEDEILAFYKTGNWSLEEILEKFKRKGGVYDYFNRYRGRFKQTIEEKLEPGVYEKNKETINKALEQVLVNEYRREITKAINAIKELEEMGKSRDEIIYLLITEPLSRWEKLVNRIKQR